MITGMHNHVPSGDFVEIVRLRHFGQFIFELKLNHLGHRNAFFSCPYYLSWLPA